MSVCDKHLTSISELAGLDLIPIGENMKSTHAYQSSSVLTQVRQHLVFLAN